MHSLHSRKGFALATVFILSALLCLMAAALLKYTNTEFRLNQRNQLRFQAKNAAEAMAEYGASELTARMQLKRNFTTAELRSSPLVVQNNRKATLYPSAAGNFNNVDPTSLELWVSQFTDPTVRTLDPKDPGNKLDPLAGQTFRTIIIRLLGKATASAPNLSTTQYSSQSLEIRDVYLFNYAIFYNVKMEFHPGANMVISGPVHSNQDTYLTTDYSLKFLDHVTTASKFYAGQYATGRPTGQNVYFANGKDANSDGVADTVAVNDSGLKNLVTGSALGTYVDSTLASRVTGNDFSTMASNVWAGNIQDSVPSLDVPGIPANNAAKAHTLIEPPDNSGSADAEIEKQKFANKAGLYIFQGANSGGTPPAPVAFLNAADAADYKAQSTAAARTTWLAASANKGKVVVLPTGVINTNRRMYDFREASTVNTVDIDVGALRTAVNSTASASTNIKSWNSSHSAYDSDLALDSSTTRNGDSDTNWNGQVYVEVENPNAGFNTTSDVVGVGSGSGTRTAVRLVNGSQVPNRKEATGSATAADGFTVATNAPVYITGNLNSPGMNQGYRGGVAVGTETAATIGTEKDGESPVAIAADAINILSNAWWSSGSPVGDATSSLSTRPAASTNTEIAAAFLTGNVPSASGGSYSGGVENFPRFLENWGSSRTIRYRGSMVALFNSTVATGPVSRAGYTPPDRQWGFSKMFASGRQPPGTPLLRSYRRISDGDLTAAQFNALKGTAMFDFRQM